MIKHFCDLCGDELRSERVGQSGLLETVYHGGENHTVDIGISLKDDKPTEICLHCVFVLVGKADKRPKAVAKAG